MKVIKDNYNKSNKINMSFQPYPRLLTCEWCNSEIEYEESDLRMGEMGCNFIDCPLCGGDNMLGDNEYNINLIADNIEFPTHFHHTSKENGAVDLCNTEEIRTTLKKAIEHFRKNKNDFSWGTWCGNLFVRVDRYSGDEVYYITVSNDFYTTEIFFEDEDY